MAITNFSAEETRILRKVSWRFLWFILLLFMVNFIDRTNVGFAALTMNKELGISASMFALSLTCFAVAYFLCEIPSNLILERVGARIWLSRIAVTWGIASTACMLIVGVKSLIGLRVLVGIAEAGFAPGAVLYMTYWFPQYHRARAHTKFMLAQPIALALGATMSGVLIGLDGVWGLSGWRWLFLIEGLPSIVLGIIAFFYLTDRPADAKWLTPSEKTTLIACLRRDADERDRRAPAGLVRSVTRVILSRDFLLICFAYGCLIGNNSALGTWMPQIIRGMNSASMPYWMTGLLTAIPSIGALIAMPIWTRHADRTNERFWHCVLPMFVGCLGWCAAAWLANPAAQLAGLVLASMCCVSSWPVFFTLPSMVLPPKAHAAGIAFLNVVGIAGTAVTPLIMGTMKDMTGTFSASMLSMGAFLVLGGAAMFLVPRGIMASGEDHVAATAPAPAATGS
ncbi:MAG TPA: MFS transporter [Stellaceae bacterium]|nr:MFS transporter [Stellaceae bacterium]